MPTKTILILFDKSTNGKSTASLGEYESMYHRFEKKGIHLCRAPISAFDKKRGLFKYAQFFDGHWVFKNNIRPDIIFDKSPFHIKEKPALVRKSIADRFPFYNSLALSKLLSDKWLTYETFKEFSPKAVLISNKNDLNKIKKLPSSKIIIKPLTGSGGKGILIFDKSRPITLKYPFLAQELIEIKKGIKGFVSGAHDLRIMIINERPFYSYLRIPEKNKLISNLSQGGTIRVVPFNKLPRTILPFLKKIQKKLEKYGDKLYSIDMILDDNKKPWIIELNSRPGITLEKEELKYEDYFFDNLIKFWKKLK